MVYSEGKTRTFEGMDNSVMEIKASFFRFLLAWMHSSSVFLSPIFWIL